MRSERRHDPSGQQAAARSARARRVLVGGVGSLLALSTFLLAASALAMRERPAAPTRSADELGIVVRTRSRLGARASDVEPTVARFVAQGVDRAWVHP